MQRKHLFVIASSMGMAACLPGATTSQYEIPIGGEDPCAAVVLTDGRVDGAEEFRSLFACLNNMGSFDELAPMVEELSSSLNPASGQPYLEDGVALLNAVLSSPDLPHILDIAEFVIDQGVAQEVLPVAATVIDSGLAARLLPVLQAGIEGGQLGDALPEISVLLRDPRLPGVLQNTRVFVDTGLAEGWLDPLASDVASLLTLVDAGGNPALREVLPPVIAFLGEENGTGLVPVVDRLLDTGTLDSLLVVLRDLSDGGELASLDDQLRPLLVQDALGNSDLQGALEIAAGTDEPLYCGPFQVVPNIAELVLLLMADLNPSTIQSLVAILRSTLGIANLLCAIPPEVAQHIDSLDRLARSGALDGLLPVLKVFKEQGQIGLLADLLADLHESGSMPALEPAIVAAIDAGAVDGLVEVIPHLVESNGQASPELAGVLETLDVLVSPTDAGDLSTAPAMTLIPLAAAAASGGETALADALYLTGLTLQDPASGFDAVYPALSAALAADPSGDLLLVAADLIDTGTVERALPMTSLALSQGHVEALLPWASALVHDGTAEALVDLLSRTLDLL